MSSMEQFEVGHHAPKRGDSQESKALCAGEILVKGKTHRIPQGAEWNGTSFDSGLTQHFLWSLRWLDPLRREATGFESAEADCWRRVVADWADSEVANDVTSPAWKLSTLLQRSRTLALGSWMFIDDAVMQTLASRHKEQLLNRLGDPATASSQNALFAELLAWASAGFVQDGLVEATQRWLGAVVDGSGYSPGTDLEESQERRGMVSELLKTASALGVDTSLHEQRVNNGDFLPHLLTPRGEFVEFGPRVAPRELGVGSALVRYGRTAGAEGSPPKDLVHVSSGLVTGRTGWGETERDYDQESFFSIFFAGRGGVGHEDYGRVTFSANGVDWLVDPCGGPKAAEYHSVFKPLGRAPIPHRGMTLEAEHHDDAVSGFTFKSQVYAPLSHERRVIWSRTGEYLVVQDAARQADAFTAEQTWMFTPEAQITIGPDGIVAQVGEAKALVQPLLVSGPNGQETCERVRVEPVMQGGTRIAWRVTFVVRGPNVTLSTFVGRMRSADIRVTTERAKDGFVVKVVDGRLEESLAVVPRYAATVPLQCDPASAVDDVRRRITNGGLSDEEVLKLRKQARDVISDVKGRVWEQQGSLDSRCEAIEALSAFAKEHGVTGLLDHGLAAAMVDLGWSDLADESQKSGLPSGAKRTPLINWTGAQYLHEYYREPLITTRPGEVPDEWPRGTFVHTVDFGQLVLPSMIVPAEGKVLSVSFHGATDRLVNSLPRFERIRTLRGLGIGPVMAFSDPSLDLDGGMILSWYAGHEEINMHAEIARLIEVHAKRLSCDRIALIGNSGGGLAALQVGLYLQDPLIVAFNPQIVIEDYSARLRDQAYWALYGARAPRLGGDALERLNAMEEYSRIEFDRDAVLVQNTGDAHHMDCHFGPFMQESRGYAASRVSEVLLDLGPGHRAPTASQSAALISEQVKRKWPDLEVLNASSAPA